MISRGKKILSITSTNSMEHQTPDVEASGLRTGGRVGISSVALG